MRQPRRGNSNNQKNFGGNWYMWRTWGLSLKDLEKMFAEQEGKCPICRNLMTLRESKFSKTRAVLDHDHKTGKRRGLICNACNLALGFFKDDIDTVISAVVYLRSFIKEPEKL